MRMGTPMRIGKTSSHQVIRSYGAMAETSKAVVPANKSDSGSNLFKESLTGGVAGGSFRVAAKAGHAGPDPAPPVLIH